jgi:hypothetical protein
VVAGATFTFLPAVFLTYLPQSLSEIPTATFGLGAVLIASNPEGSMAMNARMLGSLVGHFRSKSPRTPRGAGSSGPGATGSRTDVLPGHAPESVLLAVEKGNA